MGSLGPTLKLVVTHSFYWKFHLITRDVQLGLPHFPNYFEISIKVDFIYMYVLGSSILFNFNTATLIHLLNSPFKHFLN